MDDNPVRPSFFTNPVFPHHCRFCGRRKLLEVFRLGAYVKCDGCGRLACAADAENESAAMLDPLKLHAELADLRMDESGLDGLARLPR